MNGLGAIGTAPAPPHKTEPDCRLASTDSVLLGEGVGVGTILPSMYCQCVGEPACGEDEMGHTTRGMPLFVLCVPTAIAATRAETETSQSRTAIAES